MNGSDMAANQQQQAEVDYDFDPHPVPSLQIELVVRKNNPVIIDAIVGKWFQSISLCVHPVV
ncbi:hypothetical protein GCM10023228_11460 [Brevibacillus fulvus]